MRSQKSGGIVTHVSETSEEQQKGSAQIARSMADLEGVTQSNAAQAEQTSAASQELNRLATQMEGVASELEILVMGGGGRTA